jgi:hypothetical protein
VNLAADEGSNDEQRDQQDWPPLEHGEKLGCHSEHLLPLEPEVLQ